jgi:hypothetical protein
MNNRGLHLKLAQKPFTLLYKHSGALKSNVTDFTFLFWVYHVVLMGERQERHKNFGRGGSLVWKASVWKIEKDMELVQNCVHWQSVILVMLNLWAHMNMGLEMLLFQETVLFLFPNFPV